jgi:hypothetical protein
MCFASGRRSAEGQITVGGDPGNADLMLEVDTVVEQSGELDVKKGGRTAEQEVVSSE